MAYVEKVVRVKDNEFDFDNLISFRTKSYVGGWNGDDGYAIFSKEEDIFLDDIIDTVYADNLEDLMNEVENSVDEEIIEVYNRNIITLSIDI